MSSCYSYCVTENSGCLHCYSEKYQQESNYNPYIDKESNNNPDKYLYCPASYCIIQSCVESLDDETDKQYRFGGCCNNPEDPLCHDCSCFFFPCGISLDILTFPFRMYYCYIN